ncbi:MAG TPA: DUF6056 family protein [Lachnospiraceae bacterium]|nr:DUF6056 family protein [Lachnospiraceae bacterium]
MKMNHVGNKLKKILCFEMNEKVMAALAIVGFIVLLLPLIRLAMYAMPWQDDFYFACQTKNSWNEFGSVWKALMAALSQAKVSYYDWQGTFSSIFMMALCTGFLGDELYLYGVIFVLLFTVFAIMTLCMVVGKYILRTNLCNSILLAVIVTTSLIELIYTAQQGLYFYNAAVHYTFMHGCMFFMVSTAIKVLFSKNCISQIGFTLLTTVFAIACSGSNYVTCLQALLVFLTIIMAGIRFKKKSTVWLSFPLILYCIGFYLNVTAPGNQIRAAYYHGDSPIQAVIHSFQAAFTYFGELTGPYMLIFVILLIPVTWNIVSKMTYSFRLPGIVSAYSICLYATGFTSSFYSMGTAGLGRAWVVIKFTLQILIYLNEFYWLGWLIKQKKKKNINNKLSHYFLFYFFTFMFVILIFYFIPNKAGTLSSYGAYYYVHTGEANNFREQYLERAESIKNSGDVVELKPLVWKPFFLCMGDVDTDPSFYGNRWMASWYGKQAIYLVSD